MWIQVRSMDGRKSVRIDNLSKLTPIEQLRERLAKEFSAEPVPLVPNTCRACQQQFADSQLVEAVRKVKWRFLNTSMYNLSHEVSNRVGGWSNNYCHYCIRTLVCFS